MILEIIIRTCRVIEISDRPTVHLFCDSTTSKALQPRPATIASTTERPLSLASRPSWTPDDADTSPAERSASTGSIKSAFKKWSGPSIYGRLAACEICTTKFSLWNWRHHCRKCGKATCRSCSPAHMFIPLSHHHMPVQPSRGCQSVRRPVPQRVCTLCAPILQPHQAYLEALYGKGHKGPPTPTPDALPLSRSNVKVLPVRQTIADECNAACRFLRLFFMVSPVDERIPVTLLEAAHGLVYMTVVNAGQPDAEKIGSGIVVSRQGDNSWSAPSAIGTAGLSGGQDGGDELIQTLLILSSAQAVSAFFQTQFTIGAGLDVSVGLYSQSALAQAAMSKDNDVNYSYSYSHSRGLFAGISLHGAVITCRDDVNRVFYDHHVTPTEILSGAVLPPQAARGLYAAIGDAMRYFEGDRVEEAKPHVASCVVSGCPCEKFRARSYTTMCGNCGHSHQL